MPLPHCAEAQQGRDFYRRPSLSYAVPWTDVRAVCVAQRAPKLPVQVVRRHIIGGD